VYQAERDTILAELPTAIAALDEPLAAFAAAAAVVLGIVHRATAYEKTNYEAHGETYPYGPRSAHRQEALDRLWAKVNPVLQRCRLQLAPLPAEEL
jgi:hypothetical protein